jgi:hypothetical protein
LDLHQTLDLVNLVAFAFLVNLPLGYMRENSRRYSLRWFVYIHLSIPFIAALRFADGLSWKTIPITIAFAVTGQILGGRICRRARRP